MDHKIKIITMLKDEFTRWEELLAGLSEAQIAAPNLIADLSIQDIIAHLMAWQQFSIARLEAARDDRKVEFSKWTPELDPTSEDDLDKINAWIYKTHHNKPWEQIHREWREGFLRFIELADILPEKNLFETGRYSWLKEYPLSAVLMGSHEHHEEHIDEIEKIIKS